MNPAPPFLFPPGRTVAAALRELAHYQPKRIWLAHLLIHRVEALAELNTLRAIDGLHSGVLRSLVAGQRPEGLEPGLLSRLIRDLSSAGLLDRARGTPQATPAGRQALANGAVTQTCIERLCFCFVDNSALQREPHFLHVRGRGSPVEPPGDWNFQVSMLLAAIRQSTEWKSSFGFPLEVTSMQLPQASDSNWRSIVLDLPEYLFVIFIETESAGPGRLLGFAMNPASGSIEAGEPVISVGPSWSEALPDLAVEASQETWKAAWQGWGSQRGFPPADLLACQMECSGLVLRTLAPRRLVARLRELRSEALRGETWLLAGAGRSRAAARVEIVERDG